MADVIQNGGIGAFGSAPGSRRDAEAEGRRGGAGPVMDRAPIHFAGPFGDVVAVPIDSASRFSASASLREPPAPAAPTPVERSFAVARLGKGIMLCFGAGFVEFSEAEARHLHAQFGAALALLAGEHPVQTEGAGFNEAESDRG